MLWCGVCDLGGVCGCGQYFGVGWCLVVGVLVGVVFGDTGVVVWV